MSEGKFLTLWMKYLPAIRILLKKSVNEDQQISLGKMELQTLDNRKNANFSFNLALTKGKVENTIRVAAIGNDLFNDLSNDSIIMSFMEHTNIMIQLSRT